MGFTILYYRQILRPFHFDNNMGYRIARLIFILIVRLAFRIEIEGYENRPKTGACIVVSNHLGRLDGILVYAFIDRRDVILMVAEKYRKNALIRWFVKQLDAMWVDRFNADFHAIRTALNHLKAGHMLVMAPEGTRSKTEALQEARAGSSYLAAKAGVPIYPVALIGSEDSAVYGQLLRLHRPLVKARVGQPFTLPPLNGPDRESQLAEHTDEIMCRIAALLPPSYRGIYAEHPRLKELLAAAPA
jgi:1-acyl-sn-glycerol-3-phosphate acyltransferase